LTAEPLALTTVPLFVQVIGARCGFPMRHL
jgi:hypothetical protein